MNQAQTTLQQASNVGNNIQGLLGTPATTVSSPGGVPIVACGSGASSRFSACEPNRPDRFQFFQCSFFAAPITSSCGRYVGHNHPLIAVKAALSGQHATQERFPANDFESSLQAFRKSS